MLKEYLFQILASDLLLAIAYTIIFLVFLIAYASILGVKNVLALFSIGFGYLIYASLFLVDTSINVIPFNPDINVYTKIFNNPSYYFHAESMLALQSFAVFSMLFKPFLLNSILNYTLLHIFVFFIACVNMVSIFSKFYSKEKNANFHTLFFLLIAFLPSGLLFITQPIRDAWLVFGFSIFLYGLFYLHKKMTKYFLLLSGFFVTFWVRPQIFVFEFLYLLSFHFFRLKHKLVYGVLFSVLLVLGAPIITALTKVKLNAAYLAYFRMENIIKHGDNLDVYGLYDWTSFLDLIIDGPKLFLQFLLAPLPIIWKGNYTDMLLASVDALLVLVLSLIIILNIRKVLQNYFLWFACLFLFFAIFGLVEFHVTAALRHRLPGTLMLLILSVHLLTNRKNKLANVNA